MWILMHFPSSCCTALQKCKNPNSKETKLDLGNENSPKIKENKNSNQRIVIMEDSLKKFDAI